MFANYISGIIRTKRDHHFLLLLLLLITPCASSLTFDFPPFQQIDHTNSSTRLLLTEGDTLIANQFLDLNINSSGTESVGRATYGKPFLLKENGTGKLVDFKTSFAFVIDSKNSTAAEGLAFFLAPNGSLLNKALGVGSSLGLPVNSSVGNVIEPSNEYPFVAVEFDIHRNPWPTVEDPVGDHVGIDVNCVKSNITRPWNGGFMEAKVNRAWISYNSSSKNLSVAYTSYVPGTQEQVISHLSYMVDLNKYLRDWVIVGFSASTGAESARPKIISWSFTSTSLVDDESLGLYGAEKKQESPVSAPRKRKKPLVVVISSTVGGGGFIIVCLVGLGLFNSCKKRPTGEGTDENLTISHDLIDQFGISRPMQFSYSQLASATTRFADREKLGDGAFGVVYRGFIKELNSYVAIKKTSSKQELKEVVSELKIASRLRHRNLMELIGWCNEKGQFLLVYEFMPNGRLDSHLFEDKRALAWEVRYKIVQGLASGLLYLHQELEQCVLHRDIKSSSVMLDSNFNPKLGNFGSAGSVDHEAEMETTTVVGTIGYMAPECFTTGKASKKSDVYSFGVVALEIACGRKPWDFVFGNSQITMVEWVWELYGEGKILEAADPKLCGDFDEKQMECLLILGLWCAHPDYNSRPPIQRAILALNFQLLLPILPSKMPTTFSPVISLSRSSSTYSEAGEIESDSTVVTPITQELT